MAIVAATNNICSAVILRSGSRKTSTRAGSSPVTGNATRRREAITIGSVSAWVLAVALVGNDSSSTSLAAQVEREKLATQDVERIQKSEFVQDLLRKSKEKK